MSPIAPQTIYTKTAKGVLEIRNKTVKLPRELGLVFLSVDGKATVGDLLPRSGMSAPQFQHALTTLVTDGYIKVVSAGGGPTVASDDSLDLDFTSPQTMAKLNMEAASRALAGAEASKRAQSESRAATEARLRQEAEARARALAEARAEAEADARAKAEEAARIATAERMQAEVEVAQATNPAARAQAEARVRTAAAAGARAEAEARVRAEAEARARALAETKKAAEGEAREEAEARARSEEQAQARAAAEGRAREAVEAQLQAMEGARAYADDPQAPEGDAARARVRKLEQEADRARDDARAVAQAEGRAHEEPQPALDIADRVRQLNAKVQAVRQQREDAGRTARDVPSVEFKPSETGALQEGEWPSLQLGMEGTPAKTVQQEPTAEARLPEIRIEPQLGSADGGATNDLPVVDLDRAEPPPPPHPEQHVQTALERAMAQAAARAQAADEQKPVEAAKPVELAMADDQEVAAQMQAPPEPEPEPAPTDKNAPTIDDDEPLHERLNIDRAAHDIIAETAAARRKAEAAALTRSAVDARRQKKVEEARREAVFERSKRRRRAMVFGSVGLLVVLGATVASFQFSPLNGYIPGAQQALSERLNQPVTITSLRYVFLPTPRLVLEGVAIGQTEGVRAKRVDARALPFTLFGAPKRFDTVEAQGVTIDPSMLGTIPAWTGGRTASAVHVDRLRLTDVKLDIPKSELGSFNGEATFAPNGTLKQAVLGNDKMKLELAPQSDGVRAAFDATAWKLPFGPGVAFDYVTVKGVFSQAQLFVGNLSGRIAGGALQGTINAKWSGPIALEGDFKLDNAQLRDLSRQLMPALEGKGTVKAAGRYTMQAPTAAAALTNPQVEAAFSVVRGELTNIDLVRGIQSPGAAAFRGGRTGFEELAGTLQVSNGRYVYRQVQLTSGPLNATASLEVSPGGELTGRLNAELASKGGIVARQVLAIGGTVKDPQLRR